MDRKHLFKVRPNTKSKPQGLRKFVVMFSTDVKRLDSMTVEAYNLLQAERIAKAVLDETSGKDTYTIIDVEGIEE